MKNPRAIIAAASIVVLAACESSPKAVVAPPVCALAPSLAIAPALVPEASHYDSIFAAIGAELGVPVELLRAIGYLETRWQMVEGHEEFPGMPAAYGVMGLRGERLRQGARLARHTETEVRTDPAANIRAGAALLRAYADSLGISGDDPDHWAPAVARFSGIELPAGRESYVRELSALREGRRSNPAPPALSQSAADACAPPPASPADQAGVVWRPSPNYNQRMSGVGGQAQIVIIHSCEGSYIGCWSWLANSSSQVSAHYVVREDGAEITQLVQEASRAWHIAAIYDSTLNSGHGGHLHGIQSNHFTIGVEHAGYASQTSWSAAQIEASARLVCDVARRWQIPRDRLHFVAHGQLQPYNRTDPGAWWPWDDYLARIERNCS